MLNDDNTIREKIEASWGLESYIEGGEVLNLRI